MKKIKKILIFVFIAVLGGILFFVPIRPKAIELNENTVIENVPKSIKLYFADYIDDTDGAYYYFDFTFLDSYYNYFIINLTQYYDSIEILPVVYLSGGWEVFSLDGFYESRREYLFWEIYFGSSFDNSYYVLATNYDYIFNLDNNVAGSFSNGYYIGYDEGYYTGKSDGINEGWQPAYDSGYDYGYDKGYDDGYDNGIKKVFNNGFIGTDFNDNQSYPYYQGFNQGIETASDNTFYGIISQVFSGIGTFLAIELLPNITFGAIFAVPLVFGIIFFIIGKRGGKDD